MCWFAVQLIPTGSIGDLLASECWKHGEEVYNKWEAQILATVEILHAHDIGWGDVNAGNIVIDKDSKCMGHRLWWKEQSFVYR